MHYLLIEDSEDIGQAVHARLLEQGHAVDWAQTLAEADAILAGCSVDLIVLDIMLPDGDGRDFLARHRARKDTTPVLVLTARSQVSDRVSVLDLGADDYLTKPFDLDELDARCRALIRRSSGSAQDRFIAGTLVYDPLSSTLTVDDSVRQLRNRENRLLEVLFRAKGRVLSKAQLLDSLFSLDADVSENTIEVYIGRLRQHLSGSDVRIETVRGAGYRLSGT
ncbi:MAG: response regulator transcription factor [Pseudomonadota bacterium]